MTMPQQFKSKSIWFTFIGSNIWVCYVIIMNQDGFTVVVIHLTSGLFFFLCSMAFISGTQRDTVRPRLVLLRLGHRLPLRLTGPSYSSASEEISIFCMMSFSRQCCFSSMPDISFILRGKWFTHYYHKGVPMHQETVLRLCMGSSVSVQVNRLTCASVFGARSVFWSTAGTWPARGSRLHLSHQYL